MTLLELRGVSKRFGAVTALEDVTFRVRAGEVVALLGDNGAGKSTLAKIIAGTHQADSGTYLFEGRVVHVGSPQAAAALGIATVYQDLALCENLDVVANLFLGRRGKIYHALLGALVITSVENGLDLLGKPSSTKDIATGAILVLAVCLDAISRRRRAAAGA